MKEKELMNTMTNQKKMTIESREVSRMIEMEHKNLLARIDKYMGVLTELNFKLSEYFIESSYQDSTGRTCKCYLLTKMGCEMVANKLTGNKGIAFTAKYVKRFNEMEEQLNRQLPQLPDFTNPVIAARAWADAMEQKQEAEKQVQLLTPKAEYTDMVLDSDVLVNISTIAADYGMSGCELNRLLGELKVQYRFNNKGRWYLYKKYKDKGYVHTKTFIPEGHTKPVVYTAWTQKGSKFIHDLLKENGKLTVAEILSKNKD